MSGHWVAKPSHEGSSSWDWIVTAEIFSASSRIESSSKWTVLHGTCSHLCWIQAWVPSIWFQLLAFKSSMSNASRCFYDPHNTWCNFMEMGCIGHWVDHIRAFLAQSITLLFVLGCPEWALPSCSFICHIKIFWWLIWLGSHVLDLDRMDCAWPLGLMKLGTIIHAWPWPVI